MISVNDLKNGLTIIYNNQLYLVLEFQHVKPGKGAAFVRTKLRNVRTSAIQDITFNTNEKVKKAHVEKKSMVYMYRAGENCVFMDNTTYEQLEVPAQKFEQELKFMIENTEVTIIDYEGEILGLNLPEKVEVEVIECEPNAKGDTKSGGDKKAKIQTGYELRVPLFIVQGEKIIVNTSTGAYVSRV